MQKKTRDIQQLKTTAIALVLMLLLLPFKGAMAVSEGSAWWTHFVYMLAHGNLIHLAVNGWALLLMHRILLPYRVVAAYIAAVIVSYCYYPELPVLGASTVIMFMTGYMLPWIRQTRGWGSIVFIAACMSVGFIVPQLAGMYHLLCTLAGLVFFYVDRTVQGVWSYCAKE